MGNSNWFINKRYKGFSAVKAKLFYKYNYILITKRYRRDEGISYKKEQIITISEQQQSLYQLILVMIVLAQNVMTKLEIQQRRTDASGRRVVKNA